MERISTIGPLLFKYGGLKNAIPASLYLHNQFTKKQQQQQLTKYGSPRKDYYELLGVNQNSTEYEIRSAYRRLALEYHPDHNPSPESAEHFRTLTAAYETLKDPETRRKYDMERQAFDFQNLFKTSKTHASSTSTPTQTISHDIRHTIQASLEDLYLGKRKKFQVNRMTLCSTCHGKGVSRKDVVRTTQTSACTSCNGKGYRNKLSGPTKVKKLCSECGGKGTKESLCSECNGSKRISTPAVFRVQILPGMSSGHSIVFEQEGDEPEEYAPNKKRGDVVFTIEEKPHQLFLRHGNHLFMKHKLSLTEALRGQFQIPHLDGRILNVVSKSPLMSTSAGLKSRPASLLKYIPNAGMPIFCENKKHIEQYGNLYVQLCVDYPSTSSMTHGVSDLSKLLPTKLISETVEEAPQGEPLYLLDVNVNDVDLPASWRQA